MADKAVTVAVPEERVPEFYAWFARFLASEPGGRGVGRGRRDGRGRGGRHDGPGPRGPWDGDVDDDPAPWTADDADKAAWLYSRLAPPARRLVDVLAESPGARVPGNELAAQLGLEKGAHGVAGILAWPGRYSRRLGRQMPILTEGREDGGTDYYMDPDVAALFSAPTTARAE